MGTRGAIARKNGENGFTGVYHHWDSNPQSLGKTLFDLFNGFFKQDLEAMLKKIIDDHPAGWSTINGADFSQEAGWKEPTMQDIDNPKRAPICYCHGGRSEDAWIVTDENASGSGCEWAYVFDIENKFMHVVGSYLPEGGKMIGFFGSGDPDAIWRTRKTVDLMGQEPDWEKSYFK